MPSSNPVYGGNGNGWLSNILYGREDVYEDTEIVLNVKSGEKKCICTVVRYPSDGGLNTVPVRESDRKVFAHLWCLSIRSKSSETVHAGVVVDNTFRAEAMRFSPIDKNKNAELKFIISHAFFLLKPS